MALVASALIGCGGHSTPQHFLYGRNGAAVYGFSEDRTGALTPLAGSPFTVTPTTTPFTASGLTSDPRGRFLFIPSDVASICCPVLAETVYSIDSNTGAVGASAITNVSEGSVIFHQSGITNVGEGSFAFHPSGKFLYIASFPTKINTFFFHGIAGVDLSTSNLAAIPGSPFSDGQQIFVVSSDPAGHFLYAQALLNPGTVNAIGAFEIYSVNATTGSLTLISTDTTNLNLAINGPILFHPSGKFAYALTRLQFSTNVDLYSVNPATGALTFLNTQAQGTILNSIMSSNGNFLYGCLGPVGPLSPPCQPVAYRVDSNTGALTAIPRFSLGPGDGSSLVID